LSAQPCAGLQVATSVTVPPQGGPVPVTVTAPALCNWWVGGVAGSGTVTLPPNIPSGHIGTFTLPFTSIANRTGNTLTEELAIFEVGPDIKVSPNIVFTQAPYVGGALTLACPAGTATVGVPYSSKVTASGGVPPYAFIDTSPLPAGLKLDRVTGA